LDNGPSNSCPLKNVPSNSGPLEKGTGLLKNGSSGSGALGSPSGRALFKNGLSGSGPLNDGCSGSATSGNGPSGCGPLINCLSPAPVVNCLTPVGNGSSGSRPLCRGLLGGNGLSGTRVSVSAAVKSRRGVPPGVVCSRLVIGYKLGSGKAVD
jgi:hypothetical protein